MIKRTEMCKCDFDILKAKIHKLIKLRQEGYLTVPPSRQDLTHGLFYSGGLREKEGG